MTCSKLYLFIIEFLQRADLPSSHQSWGMKYNFSVYTSFWDRMFGTFWDGKNEMAVDKYRKGKEKAQIELKNKGVEGSTGGVSTALEDCN